MISGEIEVDLLKLQIQVISKCLDDLLEIMFLNQFSLFFFFFQFFFYTPFKYLWKATISICRKTYELKKLISILGLF